MHRRLLICLFCLMLFPLFSQGQTTEPVATAPVANEPLVGGALRYGAPDGWAPVGEKADRLVRYRLDNTGFIEIAVDDLSIAATPMLARQMALGVAKTIRDNAKSRGEEMLLPPRVEKDDRFWLVIHDRLKTKDGHTTDRLQIYRPFGVYIARVAVTSLDASREETEKIHRAGQDVLDRMRVGRGVRPSYYPHTRIKITPPVDWKEHKNDQPNGLVAAFTDPQDPSAKIIVRARVLPLPARSDGAKRDQLLDRMIDTERTTTPYDRNAPSRSDQVKSDPKLLKRVTGAITDQGRRLDVQTRYFVVGDCLISVRSISDPSRAGNVDQIADELTVAPIRE